MYDPHENLSEEDSAFLDAIHQQFIDHQVAKAGETALRGHLLGKQLADAERRGIDWRSVVIDRLPVTVAAARKPFRLTTADEAAIEYSRERSAHFITAMGDRTKEAIRGTIARAVEEKLPPGELSRRLFDAYGEANHNWRRIAITETADAWANGYLLSLPPGTVVVGDSSADACGWCLEHINGRAFTVLHEEPSPVTEADSWGSVWPGKTNVGRSKYPVALDGSARTPDELWHPCIPGHPTCRCRWRKLIQSVEQVEPGTNNVVPRP